MFISNSFDSSLHDNEYELKEVVLLLPLLLAPLVDSNSDASTFPILRFDKDKHHVLVMNRLMLFQLLF